MTLRAADAPPGVAGPGLSCLVGVEERYLCAVSKGFGDERGWALEDELADGAVAGAEEIDAEIAEPVHVDTQAVQYSLRATGSSRSTGAHAQSGAAPTADPRTA